MKKLALVLAILMLAAFAWMVLFAGDTTRIIINGQELTGPIKGAAGAAGLVAGLVALFCAAILLAFVVAGIGVFILGAVVAAGLLVAWFAFPLLLLLLLPLAVVWLFVAIGGGKS
jgi:hypothetical protein